MLGGGLAHHSSVRRIADVPDMKVFPCPLIYLVHLQNVATDRGGCRSDRSVGEGEQARAICCRVGGCINVEGGCAAC